MWPGCNGLIAFKPTGGHERLPVAAERERGIPFLRVHPNDLIAFRKSRGIKAKTDAIDGRLILAFVGDRLARHELRTSLIGDERRRPFNAARATLRHPSPFHDFYDRLVSANRRPARSPSPR